MLLILAFSSSLWIKGLEKVIQKPSALRFILDFSSPLRSLQCWGLPSRLSWDYSSRTKLNSQTDDTELIADVLVVCDVKPRACLCFLAFAFFDLSYWFLHWLWLLLLCFLLDFSSSSLVNRFSFSLSQLLCNPTFCSLTTPCSGSLTWSTNDSWPSCSTQLTVLKQDASPAMGNWSLPI